MTDDLGFLADLLKQPDTSSDSYVTEGQKYHQHESSQRGPLRYFDNEMRCTSTRCGAPTHYKFRGMPLCTVHCLKLMNEELTHEDE